MDDCEVESLREWSPMTDIIDKIPTRYQKGLFFYDLNITSIDVLPEFIAFGTDAGIVFWYDRLTGDLQKLRSENSSAITCLKIVSSVEYMIAAGSTNGQVSVFQIQKALPPDLNLVAPLTKVKPIERYTVRDLHKAMITCCEWSKNGMKLFSGDKNGVVVLTEIDYQAHLSKSMEILNDAYGIVQLNAHQSYLLVSTIYRSIMCEREKCGSWKILQIGKKDRRVLNEFGATFREMVKREPNIICCRPGLRFWIADVTGNVLQTILFKDAIAVRPKWDIALLNPAKKEPNLPTNFGRVLVYCKDFVITYDKSALYVLNLEQLRVEAASHHFRNIIDLAICGKEIFVLEGSRTLIRIAPSPEPPNKTSKIIFNPSMPPPVPNLSNAIFSSPIEFEAEEEAVANAEEAFELPPIEHIDLDISIQTTQDSPTTETNKLIIEQVKRIEVFNKINGQQFDEEICYKGGTRKKNKKPHSTSKKKPNAKVGIVEIGQAAIIDNQGSNIASSSSSVNKSEEKLTRPDSLEASFCLDSSIIPEIRSPGTLQRILEPKEKALAEALNLIPVQLEEISPDITKKSSYRDKELTILKYPLSYGTPSVDDAQVQTTPRRRVPFISDDDLDYREEYQISPTKFNSNKSLECDSKMHQFSNLCDDMKNVMIQSESSDASSVGSEKSFGNSKMPRNLQFVAAQVVPTPTVSDNQTFIPDIVQMPENMRIPSLWNVQIERSNSENSGSQTSSEWEIVDS